MQTGLQTEVLPCPNCKEEVPKTLYCLNCGYPLYKIEEESAVVEEKIPETTPEPIPHVEDSLIENVSEDKLEPQTDEQEIVVEEDLSIESVVDSETLIEDEVVVTSEPGPDALPEITFEETDEPESEHEFDSEIKVDEEEDVVVTIDDSEDTIEEDESDKEEVQIEYVETFEDTSITPIEIKPSFEEDEETFVSTEDATIDLDSSIRDDIVESDSVQDEFEDTTVIEVEVESSEVVVDVEKKTEFVPEYEPDPVIREVMENLAKNISMKIKLVYLLKQGGVKTEIFRKLFDNYITRGDLLMNSRSEMLERVRYDLGLMERALQEASKGLEELEIRKTIDDISDEEYNAKAPGYQWDIRQYKDDVGKKKAEIYYLEDITRVMSSEDIENLVNIGEGSFEALDKLVETDELNSDSVTRIRVSLEEALACIR
jgi:hypothetical protein